MKSIFDKRIIDKYLEEANLEVVFTEAAKKKMHLKLFDNKETVIHKDEQITTLSIIMEGTLKVIPFSGEGKDALIDYIKKGQLLGDIEYFCGGTSIHGVVSKGKSLVLQIPYKVIEEELIDYSPFLLYISNKLATKLHNSSRAHSNFLLYSTKSQLYRYILDESEKQANEAIPIKNSELAQLLGSSDRHIRRLICELIDEGIIIKVKRGYIKIFDIKALEEKLKRE